MVGVGDAFDGVEGCGLGDIGGGGGTGGVSELGLGGREGHYVVKRVRVRKVRAVRGWKRIFGGGVGLSCWWRVLDGVVDWWLVAGGSGWRCGRYRCVYVLCKILCHVIY